MSLWSSKPATVTMTGDVPHAAVSAAAIQPDFESNDEGYAESTTTSFVSSIASDIRRGVEENGRTYPAYGKNAYGLPVDEPELERNDLQHCKFSLILDGHLHLAPIVETPHSILDLGTGTGVWAIDMADKYPSADVIGVDIAAVQPSWVPPNCHFEIDDVESEWLYQKDRFDFIHGREFLLSIRDWPRLIAQSYAHLKPGTGYLELSGTYPRVGCDDNSLPPDTSYVEFTKIFFEIADALGAPATAPCSFKPRMEAAGFVDVVEHVFKIPTSPWPKDRRLKQIGALELANFNEGMEAFLVRGYTTFLGGDRNTMEVTLAHARREARDPRMHTYIYFYNVYGRRPGPSESGASIPMPTK